MITLLRNMVPGLSARDAEEAIQELANELAAEKSHGCDESGRMVLCIECAKVATCGRSRWTDDRKQKLN